MNKIFLIFILILVTFLTFSSALDNSFTNWDDPKYLTQNKRVHVLSLETVSDLFTRTKIIYHHYIPLTLLSFSIEHHFFGLNPKVFIFNNIILHCINVILVFWFIFLLVRRVDVAFLTSVLFAVHPMRVESVAWIVERKDVLFTLFYLGALISYSYGIKNAKKINGCYLITFVLFLCSLLSKPAAVTLPLVLLLLDYYFKRKNTVYLFVEKIPFFILSIIFGLIAMGQARPEWVSLYSRIDRIMLGSYSFIAYIVKLFMPVKLSCFYPVPLKVEGSFPPIFSLAPFGFVVLLVLILLFFRKSRKVMFGALFYFLTIFPMTFIGASTALMADRYTYLPYTGIFFMISAGVCFLTSRILPRRIIIRLSVKIVIFCLLILLSLVTFERCKVWKNGMTLWNDVIAKYPDVVAAYINRGNEYGKKGEFDLAISDYNKALNIDPHKLTAYTSRGYVYY